MLQPYKPRGFLILLTFLSLLTLVVSACQAAGNPGNSSSANGGKPVHGGTWVDDFVNEPDSLLPNLGVQTFNVLLDEAIYSPLFVGDSQGHIQPYAATEIPTQQNGGVSADAKTWTFHMRPGLKWSDGQPYTAEDVDFTWKLWDNPKFGAGQTDAYHTIQSATVSPDKLSITFHLKRGYSPFLASWTDGGFAPLPAHHFASMDPAQIAKSKDNLDPSVVSGAFMMSESVPGSHYTVVRNPNYFQASQGLPYLDKIVFQVIADENTILNNAKAGSVTSTWFLDVSKTTSYKALAGYQFVVNPDATNVEKIVLNFQNPILGKYPEVRKAMAMAIDHTTLIKDARKGTATPLCTDHGPGLSPGFQANAPCPAYNAGAANQLLDQNGWVKGADGVRTKNGMRLEFKYSTTSGKPWRDDDESIIQSDMQAIGIKIDIQNYPANTFFGSFLPSGKHDLAEFEDTFTYDPDDATLTNSSQIPSNNGGQGENYSWYSNPKVDQLQKQEEASSDPTERQNIFNQLHQIYLTDYPFIVLYSPEDAAIVKSTAHNYAPGPMGASETVGIWKWWCTNGQC